MLARWHSPTRAAPGKSDGSPTSPSGGQAMTRPAFQGSIVALVTPFRNGKVDEAKLRELVDFHVAQRHGRHRPLRDHRRIPDPEPRRAQARGRDRHRGRAQARAVIAGTGSNSTAEAIDLTTHAKKAGADAARSWSTRTTTSPPRRACTGTSARWPRRSTSRSSSTTSRAAPRSTSRPTRWRAWSATARTSSA